MRLLRRLADRIMRRRAAGLFELIKQHLPERGVVVDIGSGTGHNAECLSAKTSLEIVECDVVDLHWVRASPDLIVEGRLPYADRSATAAMLLYVLQYPPDAASLLREAARVSSERVIVLQSTYSGRWALRMLWIRELCFGRLGYHGARIAGLVAKSDGALSPKRYLTHDQLVSIFAQAGMRVCECSWTKGVHSGLRRELFVLQKVTE